MRFTAASLLAFASAVLAQTANFDVISKPTEGDVVPAGSTYTIVWAPSAEYNNDTITLTLLGGATPQTLQLVSVIKSGVASSAGEFAWPVASSLGADANYGIEITLDKDPSILEYSFPFEISGGSVSGSGTVSASATGSTPVSTSHTKTTSASSSSLSSKTTSTKSSSASSASTTLTTKTSITKTSTTGNSTTTSTKQTGTGKQTVITQTATKTGSSATGTASTVATNDAKSLGAGSFFSLIAGLAVAFFAL